MRRFPCRLAAAAIFSVLAVAGHAADIVRTSLWSDAMKRKIPISIVLPKGYTESGLRYPVVYALHGASGSDGQFLAKEYRPYVEDAVDRFGFIVALPDGAADSWWFDSPVDPKCRFETHVWREVVPFVDREYRTVAKRSGRAICGGSMGGHGAGWLGFRHKDVFGAVGIIMGGVDFRKFPNNWNIHKRLGPYDANPALWFEHTVLHAAETLKNGEVDLISIVGTNDFFTPGNRALHELLTTNGVEHTYIEVRGADLKRSSHDRAFAAPASRTVFAFFGRYFAEGRGGV